MKSEQRNEIKVGSFITAATALSLLAIWTLGSAQNLFTHRDPFFITVPNAEGISAGAKVTISGLRAGIVDSFSLNAQDQSVKINLSISKDFENSIKKDSFAEVITEGLLGDKLIAIAAGSTNSPEIPPGSEIPARQESSLRALLGKGDQLTSHLSLLTRDLNELILLLSDQFKGNHLFHSLRKLDTILGKIDRGNGVLAGLVNDPKLLDDTKALIGESNENRIVRNIVRKTIEDAEDKKLD